MGEEFLRALQQVIELGAGEPGDGDEEDQVQGIAGKTAALHVRLQGQVTADQAGPDHQAVGAEAQRAEMEEGDHLAVIAQLCNSPVARRSWSSAF